MPDETTGESQAPGERESQRARVLAAEAESAALRDRLQFLETIFQGDRLVAYDWHVGSGEITFDAHFAGLLGYVPAAVPARVEGWWTLIHPDERDAVREVGAAYLRGAAPLYDQDYRVRHRAGDWVWVRDRCRIVARDVSGRPLRVRGALRDISPRKQAELALRESEERYRRITEAITDYIYTVRVEGGAVVETRHGPGCVALTGFDSREFGAQPLLWLSMVVEQDRPAVQAQARRLLAGEDAPALDHRLVRKDGAVRWVRNTPVVHRDEQGRLLGYDGLIHDITERKLAADALRASEGRLRSVVRVAPVGIGVVVERVLAQVNERICEMTGYTAAELIGQSARVLYPSQEEFERVGREKYDQIAQHGSGTVETRWQCQDGRVIDVLLSSSAIDPSDLGAGVTFTALDITERKLAEENLAAEKERLAVTLGSIGDGVIATDTAGRVRIVNRVAEQLTGWSQEEAVGRPLTEVFHIVGQQSRERCVSPVEQVLTSGFTVGLANHTLLIARDGRERVIADSGAPIRDTRGQVVGVVLAFRDVTEKERLGQELLKAQKLESIALLAGGIAHDFNNILTGILGNLSLAREYSTPTDRVYDRLVEAEKAASQARGLTQQLLTFSKGGTPIRRVARLGALVREATIFALRGSSVDVDFELPEDLWLAEVDAGQIHQAIHNLVLNAVQAMPGGGRIGVVAANETLGPGNPHALPPGRFVSICVADCGIGIPESLLARIFDPYFTTKERGSGLGLATTYSILRGHDGHVAVESRVDRGSAFTLYLPATDKTIDVPGETEQGVTRCQGRILVMDDEPIVRELAAEILMSNGCQVECAHDGHEAVEAFRRAREAGQPFDAVLMDLTVPGGLGGRDTIARLRLVDPQVRAIVSSGYSNDPIMANFREYGFQAVLVKPYTVAALLGALQQALAPSAGERH